MKKLKKKHILIGIAAGAILAWALWPAGNRTEIGELKTTVAKRGTITIKIVASGTVEPLRTYEIKSKASGTIINLPVDTGSTVQAGGLICELDATDERNNLEKAVSSYDVAKQKHEKAVANLSRQAELFTNNFIPRTTYEDYKLAVATAWSDFVTARVVKVNAQKSYNDTRIVAPITGVIITKSVEIGQIIASGTQSVSGGTTIAKMANLDTVYIKAYVDESDISQIQPGQSATITVTAMADKKFQGEVIKVEPSAVVEQNVTSFLVTTRIDNQKALLKPGMNATVEIQAGSVTNVVLAPIAAIRRISNQDYIFVLEKGAPVMRRIRSGASDSASTAILRGIKEGDKMIIGGLAKATIEQLVAASQSTNGQGKRGGGDKQREQQRIMQMGSGGGPGGPGGPR